MKMALQDNRMQLHQLYVDEVQLDLEVDVRVGCSYGKLVARSYPEEVAEKSHLDEAVDQR